MFGMQTFLIFGPLAADDDLGRLSLRHLTGPCASSRDGLSRSVELTATLIVVLFAVIAHGGTIARLIGW